MMSAIAQKSLGRFGASFLYEKAHRKTTHQHRASVLTNPEPAARKPRQSSIAQVPVRFLLVRLKEFVGAM
jgi:hypothetical protein